MRRPPLDASGSWCRACATQHGEQEPCPGELRATGAERHGWRITVDTPRGMETYGVLVAPCRSRWRARIVTYPDQLWVLPDGGASLKFVGDSPAEAEEAAARFILEQCERRGLRRHGVLPPVRAGRVNPEAAQGVPPRAVAPPRKLASFAVRFGRTKPTHEGRTVNLSARGMFLATDEPFKAGEPIRLWLDLGPLSLPLRGTVVWTRTEPEPGRPLGMGIRLFQPPRLYLEEVEKLA